MNTDAQTNAEDTSCGEDDDVVYPDGYSPVIEDCDGLPAVMRSVITSRGSFDSLEALYALINIWGEKQRQFATNLLAATAHVPPVADGSAESQFVHEALVTVTLGGIEGDEMGEIDVEVISNKRLEQLQWELVRTGHPVHMTLYGCVPVVKPSN